MIIIIIIKFISNLGQTLLSRCGCADPRRRSVSPAGCEDPRLGLAYLGKPRCIGIHRIYIEGITNS